jgi:hypothetical protein
LRSARINVAALQPETLGNDASGLGGGHGIQCFAQGCVHIAGVIGNVIRRRTDDQDDFTLWLLRRITRGKFGCGARYNLFKFLGQFPRDGS